MKRDPNMQRLDRGNLPASQRVTMGPVLASQGPAPQQAVPVQAPAADPVLKAKLTEQEEQIRSLRAELAKAQGTLQQLGPPGTSPETLLQNLKSQAKAFEDQQQELLQYTAVSETMTKKVKDLEDELATATKMLDTSKPLDKVWVTAVQSRTVENGNVVVACTMHSGLESELVTGTLLIPQSEFGKLKPPKQQP